MQIHTFVCTEKSHDILFRTATFVCQAKSPKSKSHGSQKECFRYDAVAHGLLFTLIRSSHNVYTKMPTKHISSRNRNRLALSDLAKIFFDKHNWLRDQTEIHASIISHNCHPVIHHATTTTTRGKETKAYIVRGMRFSQIYIIANHSRIDRTVHLPDWMPI